MIIQPNLARSSVMKMRGELFSDKNMRDELSELLEVLGDRERKIIFERFGLEGGKAKTLEEVGKRFGVTRERIRQSQNIALAKLRRALAKREKPALENAEPRERSILVNTLGNPNAAPRQKPYYPLSPGVPL
jgi:hypothetical protein